MRTALELHEILSQFQNAPDLAELKNYETPQQWWDNTIDITSMIFIMQVAEQHGERLIDEQVRNLRSFVCDCIERATSTDGKLFTDIMCSDSYKILIEARGDTDRKNISRMKSQLRGTLYAQKLNNDYNTELADSAVLFIPLAPGNALYYTLVAVSNCQTSETEARTLQQIHETGNLQDPPRAAVEAETAAERAAQAKLLRGYFPEFPLTEF